MLMSRKFVLALPVALLVVLPAAARGRRVYEGSTSSMRTAEMSEAVPGPALALPAGAMPGQCFTRVSIAPTFETRTEQVVTREASERIEVIPATYETVSERILVKPASHRLVDVPPQFERVEEQVLVQPARSEWQYKSCGPVAKHECGCKARAEARESRNRDWKAHDWTSRQSASNASYSAGNGKNLCLVEVPARYETVAHMEMVQPPTTNTIEIAAEYRTITRQVVKEPAHEQRVQIAAEYGTVSHQEMIADASSEWQEVECSAGTYRVDQPTARNEATSATRVSSLQR